MVIDFNQVYQEGSKLAQPNLKLSGHSAPEIFAMVPPMAVLVADIPVLQASYFMACRNFLKQKKISRYYVYI